MPPTTSPPFPPRGSLVTTGTLGLLSGPPRTVWAVTETAPLLTDVGEVVYVTRRSPAASRSAFQNSPAVA